MTADGRGHREWQTYMRSLVTQVSPGGDGGSRDNCVSLVPGASPR